MNILRHAQDGCGGRWYRRNMGSADLGPRKSKGLRVGFNAGLRVPGKRRCPQTVPRDNATAIPGLLEGSLTRLAHLARGGSKKL